MAKTEPAKKAVPEAESANEASLMEAVPQSQPTPELTPEPLVPFDRWFAAKGFKERWKPGMAAYTDVSFRRTMSEWDAIFKAY